MSGEICRLRYDLRDKERLFDIGQTVHANRKRIFRKDGVVLQPYTGTFARMRRQGICFLALAFLQGILMRQAEAPDGFDIVIVVLFLLCAVMMPLMRYVVGKNYRAALKMYRTDSGEVGYLLFDEESITDYSENGSRTVLPWADYVACVLTEEAVVILFDRPQMLLFSRDERTERELRAILDRFGKGATVYCARVKAAAGRKKKR